MNRAIKQIRTKQYKTMLFEQIKTTGGENE